VQRIVAGLSTLVLVLALGACSSPADGNPAGSDAAFCTALGDYATALVQLKGQPADATATDYQAAIANVKTKQAAMTAVSSEFAGAQLEELQTAQDDFVAASEGLTADSTPTEWMAATGQALETVIEAATGLELAVCNSTPTPSA
jgi:hypothetical protein